MPFLHSLGSYVIDQITGFKGIIVARQDHITNCNCYYVQPPVNEKGVVPEARYIDESALKIDASKGLLKLG